MSVDHRITELELGYMALERLVVELSSVVASQQRTIDALTTDLALLSAKADGLNEPRPNEKPPHY